MKITNPITYIALGGSIRYLASLKESQIIFGDQLVLENIKTLRDRLEKLGFLVSVNLFDTKVLPLQEAFEERLPLADENDPKRLLSAADVSKLTIAVLQVEETVFAEALTRVIASPVPRRFSLDHLLESPGSILGAGVYEVLTPLA